MPLQFTIPRRRKATKLGVRDARREYPRHRKFVRSHECSVNGCANSDIEFCHVRSAANSGTGLKPSDAFGISLCAHHHRIQHSIGQPAFERRFGIDMAVLAAAFTRASPDTAMKAAVELRGERE